MAPNEKYPLLDSVDSCPKCDQNFYDPDGDSGSGKPLPPSLRYGCKSSTTMSGEYQVHDEWIKRECPTCQFAWRENVASAELPSNRG